MEILGRGIGKAAGILANQREAGGEERHIKNRNVIFRFFTMLTWFNRLRYAGLQ